MVTFIIFWAVIMALVFFILSIVFKSLAAAFNGILASIVFIAATALGIVLALIIMAVLSYIASNIVEDGLLMTIAGIIVIGFIIVAIFGELAEESAILVWEIMEIVVVVAEAVITAISVALESCALACEKVYDYFLNIIIKQVDKC